MIKKKIDEKDLQTTILEVKEKKIEGINVTVPFKKLVIPYLDKLSPEAEQTQSVNTIILTDDILVGHNTDISGFTKAIKDLNLVCHEMESLINAQKAGNHATATTIVQWNKSDRWELEDHHRDTFLENKYNRQLGGVYLHWAQVGKTLLEVYNDEGAPKLDATMCEAITHLNY